MGEAGEAQIADPLQNTDSEDAILDPESKGRLKLAAEQIGNSFVSWVDTHVLSAVSIREYGEPTQKLTVKFLADKIDQSPSKDFLKKTLLAVGVYDIGLTAAGLQMGIPKEVIPLIWSATFLAPITEELMYRSSIMPSMVTEIAKRMGIDAKPEKTRMLVQAFFSAAHLSNASVDKFFTGAYLSKVAHEKGLAASIASHSLINASIAGLAYLAFEGQKLPHIQAETARNAILTTLWVELTAIGIAGAKELLDDKQTQEALRLLRSTDRIDTSVKVQKIKQMYTKLLSAPSTTGYKFTAGIELAYMSAMLEAQEYMHQPEMQEHYAKEQVKKAILANSPNAEKAEERVSFANTYIEHALHPSGQANGVPSSAPAV